MTVDSALPALAVILDEDRLSEAFGESLRADSLRYKPGVSAVARLHDGSGSARWVAVYAPGHTAKLDKLRHRAAGEDIVLRSVALPPALPAASSSELATTSSSEGGVVLTSGPVTLDYKLRKPLRKLRTSSVLSATTTVLNYNPNRRLVLSLQHEGEPVVAKITAGSAPVPLRLLESLSEAGVPVLRQINPAGLPESRHVSYYPWYGQGNLKEGLLDGTSGVENIRAAGAALAALHAQPLPAEGFTRTRNTVAAEAESKLAAMAKDLADLVPHLETRLHVAAARIGSALPSRDQPVLLHGDFSSDQILDGPGSLRIIDLDRWGRGPATADLGGFVAEEIANPSGIPQKEVVNALLNGYDGGVDEALLNAWTAFQLYCRLPEPFRSCSPDWRNQIAQRLECIEELVR